MRKVSDAELKRQILRNGPRWGLVPMQSPFGDCLVAEDIPILFTAAPGLLCLTRVRRDVTAVNTDYPWAFLLRNRKHKPERTASLRAELRQVAANAEAVRRKEAAVHELEGDIRRADKGRQIYLR